MPIRSRSAYAWTDAANVCATLGMANVYAPSTSPLACNRVEYYSGQARGGVRGYVFALEYSIKYSTKYISPYCQGALFINGILGSSTRVHQVRQENGY